MSDIYLSITETPTVVTLTNPLISSNVAQSVTVTNVVSVNVVTMPAITVQAAAPAVTTVAGSVAVSNLGLVPSSVATDGTADGTLNFVKIGGHQSGSNQTAHIVHVSAGGSMSVDATDSVVSISNFPSTQTIAGTVTASLSESLLYPNGATGLTKGIAVGFLESQIANPPEFTIPNTDGSRPFPVAIVLNDGAGYANAVGSDIGSSSLPISGAVTANVFFPEAAFSASNIASDDGGVVPDFGVQIGFTDGTEFKHVSPSVALPVSGTVTAAAPNGSLTTRFGTPTTANTAFATSAVTNANRKYLLIQNVTTGSNVITVGIGFTPTTTQGIQLTAGAGITFESSYIPTGAVQILSSVTASNFTILEA